MSKKENKEQITWYNPLTDEYITSDKTSDEELTLSEKETNLLKFASIFVMNDKYFDTVHSYEGAETLIVMDILLRSLQKHEPNKIRLEEKVAMKKYDEKIDYYLRLAYVLNSQFYAVGKHYGIKIVKAVAMVPDEIKENEDPVKKTRNVIITYELPFGSIGKIMVDLNMLKIVYYKAKSVHEAAKEFRLQWINAFANDHYNYIFGKPSMDYSESDNALVDKTLHYELKRSSHNQLDRISRKN